MTGGEPTLQEILSDPIVVALMRADGVDPGEIEAMLSRISRGRSTAHRDVQLGQAD
jgi:hypothetical protein